MAPTFSVFIFVLIAFLIRGSDAHRVTPTPLEQVALRNSPHEPHTAPTTVLAELQSHSKDKQANDVAVPDHGMSQCDHAMRGESRYGHEEYGWMTFCQQGDGKKVKMREWHNPGWTGEMWYDRGFEQAFWDCAGSGDAETGPYIRYCVDNCFEIASTQYDDGSNAACREYMTTQRWCNKVECTNGPGTICEDAYMGDRDNHEAIEIKDYRAEKYGQLDPDKAERKNREQAAWKQRQIEENDRNRPDDEKVCKIRSDYQGISWLVKEGCSYHWDLTVADDSGECPWEK